MRKQKIAGINIQWPWSELIVSGKKVVETRGYPIPEKHRGKPLAIIETPGPNGKRDAGIEKARIIAVVFFGDDFEYKSENEWRSDFSKHRVPTDNAQLKYKKGIPKWGWKVVKVIKLPRHIDPPKKRGIVFVNNCEVSL